MDKKKLLLVAVSVGVVLMIVIALPLFFISPRNARSPQQVAHNEPFVYDSIPPAAIQPSSVQHTGAIEPPAAALEPEPVKPVSSIAETAPAVSPPAALSSTTLTIPAPNTVAVPRVSDVQVKSTAPAVAQPKQAAPAEKPAVAKANTAAAPAKTVSKPASETANSYNNYWIQTGAFSTKIRAEGVKESLADKGITSIIDNRDIDGKTWYRVRVGPYTTETEAKYWLTLVQAIEGFGDSQVRQSQVLR